MVKDPSFNSAMEARLAQGISWTGTTYQHHVNTSAGAAGRDVLQIAARCRELKGLMSVMRKQTNIGSAAEFQSSRRTIQYISQYQYQVGSQNYPPNQVDISTTVTPGGTTAGTRIAITTTADLDVSEAYAEVQRLFGNLGVQSGASCLIGAESFATSELNNGTGLIGVDLSAFSDGSVMSGMNTADNALPVSLEILKTAAANAVIQIDTYAVCGVRYIRDSSGDLMASINYKNFYFFIIYNKKMTFKNIFPAQFFDNVPQPSREAIEKALQTRQPIELRFRLSKFDWSEYNLVWSILQTDSERPIYKLYTDGYAEFMMGIFDANGNFLFDG
jgi:hypothetical protein